MSGAATGGCPNSWWENVQGLGGRLPPAHSPQPLVGLQLPSLETPPLLRRMLYMQHGGSVHGQRWSRLQPQAWSPSVLQQQLLLGLQPWGTRWVSVLGRLEAQERWSWCYPLQSQGVSPPRSTPAGRMATQVNFDQGAGRVLPALTSQVGIICCVGKGARRS